VAGVEPVRQARAVDLGLLGRHVALCNQDEARRRAQRAQRGLDAGEQYDGRAQHGRRHRAAALDDIVAGLLAPSHKELPAGLAQRTHIGNRAVPIGGDQAMLGRVERLLDGLGGESLSLQERDQVRGAGQVKDIVLPERVVGVDQQGPGEFSMLCAMVHRLLLL